MQSSTQEQKHTATVSMTDLNYKVAKKAVVSARGQVYVNNVPLSVKTETMMVDAYFDKFDQCVLFSISDQFAQFLNGIVEKWVKSNVGGKCDGVSVKTYDIGGKYPPQIKFKYDGEPLHPGTIIEPFTFDVKCYSMTKGSSTFCGVYFKNTSSFKVA